MPAGRNRSESSDKNPSSKISGGKSSRDNLFDKRYEGYDEERSNYHSPYENHYDVDENDINQRSGQSKNYHDKIENESSDRS